MFFSTGSHRVYHMVTDDPQYIDYDKYAAVTPLILDVGRTVANLDQRLLVDKSKPFEPVLGEKRHGFSRDNGLPLGRVQSLLLSDRRRKTRSSGLLHA